MHYGDEEQLAKNELIIIIYKHGTGKVNKFDYAISSIKKCEYFNPFLLSRMIRNPNKYFRNALKHQIEERWYELKVITTDGYQYINILSITDVSDTDNIFDTLH